MNVIVIIVFVIGYAVIVLEKALRINKAASALLTGVVCWMLYMLDSPDQAHSTNELQHHFGEISAILFFLLGAMTIVQVIDSYDGFAIITNRIKTRSKAKLLWILSTITFILSAFLDNLTTTIVMTSLIVKLIPEKNDKLWFIGMVIIAANAGGAFSPLGDVTTTMLWIGGQISAEKMIAQLLLPSLAAFIVPLLFLARKFKNKEFTLSASENATGKNRDSYLILIIGLTLLLLTPVIKILTNLPPFMVMLFALGILWLVVSVLHYNNNLTVEDKPTVSTALQKIDTPSILFFLGILLSISALQSFGILSDLATILDGSFGNIYLKGSLLGLVSSVVDNVPLVAAVQRMYPLSVYPMDHHFWEFIALTTGTGGSMIIIGSAAGVAAMGIEKVDFFWYIKNISLLAVAGYLAGIVVFIAQILLL